MLKKIPDEIVGQFINEEGVYLTQAENAGMTFIGKFGDSLATFQELEHLEANIYSLLKKLVPNFPYEETPLYLFPLLEKTNDGI